MPFIGERPWRSGESTSPQPINGSGADLRRAPGRRRRRPSLGDPRHAHVRCTNVRPSWGIRKRRGITWAAAPSNAGSTAALPNVRRRRSVACAARQRFAERQLGRERRPPIDIEVQRTTGARTSSRCARKSKPGVRGSIRDVPAADRTIAGPVDTDVPLVMLPGRFDSFSPPAVAEAQAARLPMAWTIAVLGQTHNTLGFAESRPPPATTLLGAVTRPHGGPCTSAHRRNERQWCGHQQHRPPGSGNRYDAPSVKPLPPMSDGNVPSGPAGAGSVNGGPGTFFPGTPLTDSVE